MFLGVILLVIWKAKVCECVCVCDFLRYSMLGVSGGAVASDLEGEVV